jgi:uncharacterized protein with ParB-like and HNH nuclease domain
MIENKRNTILLLSIDQLKGKIFSIGNYQRGYKWGKKEILELLNDIHSYDKSNGIYCLQPLILKPLDEKTEKIEIENRIYEIFSNNEVIDGQQRTTTLFILVKYLVHIGLIDEKHLFNINYITRERSRIFLEENLNLIFDSNIDSISENELSEKKYSDINALNNLWETFTEQHKDFDNVDVYHFFTVACYIKKWIQSVLNTDEEKSVFIDQFLHSVKVIWYSLDDAKDNQNVIDVFLNNNKGKISLTTSELIKALFVLNIKNNEIQSLSDLQINQFALEWDHIEKKLQDDNFWYFIQSNSDLYNNGTRIDYLFDLHIKKSKKDDEYFAYRHYESLFNKGQDLTNEWEQVVQLFTKLVDWYNDSIIYHYLGFITVSGIKNLSTIITESKGKTKEDLWVYLIGLINTEFAKKGKNEDGSEFSIYELENLSYKPPYYAETKKTILLYNVLHYTSNMAKHKFPFELYVKEKWSIEHIIPQNPKDILDVDIYKQWYIDLLTYNDNKAYDEVIDQLQKHQTLDGIYKDKELKAELDKIVIEFEDTTHKIDNLLLLDRNTNSSLGNQLFKDKRVKVLRFDKNGKNDKGEAVFIPIETLNAFNKTFSEKINIENWLKQDGENYKNSISERLANFLPKTT